MRSLNKTFIKDIPFSSRHLTTMKTLGKYLGKQDLYNQQSSEALKTLKESAIIESVESSNRLEQIIAPRERIEGLVAQSIKPKDRSEEEIAGYRDGLALVHDSFEHMSINVNVIKQLHGTLYKYQSEEGGRFKSADNEIVEKDEYGNTIRVRFTPTPAIQTPDAMKNLCQLYIENLEDPEIDTLLLLPLMILDFLCIHPFKDGNGRVARLLTLLILHKFGHEVGKYISLERIFEEQKEGYYESLRKSSQGWHEGDHDPFPWLNFFWGILIGAYKEFEEKFMILKISKTEQVKLAIQKRSKAFSISDLQKDCPNISREMIRNVLRQLRDAGEIKSTGVGRGAKWTKKGS